MVAYRMGTISNRGLRILRNEPAQAPAARDSQVAVIQNRDDFQRLFMPHLDAAYNLARWLLKNEADAQDVVQDAYLRALRFSQNFRGGDARAWLLTIVRNAAYTWMSRNRAADAPAVFDEEEHSDPASSLDAEIIRKADSAALRSAMEELPAEFREMLVLRDLEGLSYKEIAAVADLPIGTVMSRLARARGRLKIALRKLTSEGDAR